MNALTWNTYATLPAKSQDPAARASIPTTEWRVTAAQFVLPQSPFCATSQIQQEGQQVTCPHGPKWVTLGTLVGAGKGICSLVGWGRHLVSHWCLIATPHPWISTLSTGCHLEGKASQTLGKAIIHLSQSFQKTLGVLVLPVAHFQCLWATQAAAPELDPCPQSTWVKRHLLGEQSFWECSELQNKQLGHIQPFVVLHCLQASLEK